VSTVDGDGGGVYAFWSGTEGIGATGDGDGDGDGVVH